MGRLEVAHGYFDAWNRRDPEGVAACFVDGGTYQDPTTGGPLTGDAIAEMVGGLLVMFPDLSFDVVSSGELSDGRVAGQWVMRGTNTGPLPGGPPLGKTIALPGADFIEVDGDRVRSVTGYFDQKLLFEQLGLAVTPLPAEAIGPFTFGYGARVLDGERRAAGRVQRHGPAHAFGGGARQGRRAEPADQHGHARDAGVHRVHGARVRPHDDHDHRVGGRRRSGSRCTTAERTRTRSGS